MNEYIDINQPEYTDLSIYSCGMEDCPSGHAWGPGVRDHFLIHYVLKGKGVFKVENTTYYVTKGDGFLICPNKLVYYQADAEEPWSYVWVGFHGLKAELYLKYASLSLANPIFRYHHDQFIVDSVTQMIATGKLSINKEIRLIGLLYLFMYQLIEAIGAEKNTMMMGKNKERYIKSAIEFIRTKYPAEISIMDIAHHVGIDRKYLCAIFKDCLNVSPQTFLIDYRMNKACDLMEQNDLSIGEISYSVGYKNPLIFSKVFKKIKGLPPREYRKKQTQL